jgi:Flp pilus assembly protein TadG
MRNDAMLLHSRAILRAGINRVRKLAGAEPVPEGEFSFRGGLKQAGQIVVIFALMVTVMIGLMGVAVDTTYAWLQALQVQSAADQASLAGVVYMPGNLNITNPSATSTALAEAAMNGYPSNSTNTITVTQGATPYELDVSITTKVPTFFSRIFGVNSFTVTRSSKAIFVLPVPMGSPENYYGSFGTYEVNGKNTALTGPGGQTMNARGFWGSILTQGADIVNGDAYMPQWNNTKANSSHDTTDYYNYAVYMPPGSTNGQVWIFDPGFCDTDSSQGTGEFWLSGTGAVSTTYELYNTNNQPYSLSLQTDLGGSGTLFNNEAYSDSNEGGSGGSSCTAGKITDKSNGEYYHDQWWELTGSQGANQTLSGGTYGTTYRIHVVTTDSTANALNNYAIFASDTGTAPSVYGIGAMQMYTPLSGTANSTFYLAQISQQAGAGKTMDIDLWDPGDTGALTAKLSILAPCAGTNCWSATSLTWTATYVATNGGNANCASASGSGTSITTSTGSSNHIYNGCWLHIVIPIPVSYTAPQNGWWQIQYSMSGSGNSTDETTWQVNIRGNPVHLI